MDNQYPKENLFPSEVKICMPNNKGKVLAVTADGSVVCDKTKSAIKDDQWIFSDAGNTEDMNEERTYHIISANYKMALDYDPVEGEQVNAVPYNGRNHTNWYTMPTGEIYCYDNDGEKKYLWSLAGNLYVTHDEHLAENWKIVNLEGFQINNTEENPKKDKFVLFLIILILILIIYVVYKNGSIF